jgi:hypothetical protein
MAAHCVGKVFGLGRGGVDEVAPLPGLGRADHAVALDDADASKAGPQGVVGQHVRKSSVIQ